MIASNKFFNSRAFNVDTMRTEYQSEFVELVRAIESAAEAKGLTLSRWQSNGSGRSVTVRYALHTGERAEQMRYQDGLADSVELTTLEGTTRRCGAYKVLAAMAEENGLWS